MCSSDLRAKDSYDGVQPSGNSQTARNLLRLATKTKDDKYRALCEKTIKQFALTLRMQPASVPAMARCLDEFLAVGEPTNPGGKVEPPKNPKESADVVTAKLEQGRLNADTTRDFTLTLTIADGWHIYANPVGNETLKESETVVTFVLDGKPVEAKVVYPKGKEITDSTGTKYAVYEGTVKITGALAGPPTIEARVKVTACKEARCLLPSVIKVK